MVDFGLLLKKERAWEQRARVKGCACVSRVAIRCWEKTRDRDAVIVEIETCECDCHKEPEQ